MVIIELKKIKVIFHIGDALETCALKEINLTINKGDFITAIGSNGSGKSTLLNIISGEVAITEGEILFYNNPIQKLPVHKRASFISRVFQDPLMGSCAYLTVEENMILAINRCAKNKLKLASNKKLTQYFKEQLSRLNLGLEDRLNDKIGKLSGGQRQAVSLLMSNLCSSDLLLLDEHTASLDPKTAHKVLDLTCNIINENNLTALMVTHSMQQALNVGNRIIMLHLGNIILDVTGEDREKLKVQDLLDLFSNLNSI